MARRRRREGFDDDLLERAQRSEQASGELEKRFEALSATAELDQVIFDGASFGTAGAGRYARGGGVSRPARAAQPRTGLGAAQQAPGRAAGRRSGGGAPTRRSIRHRSRAQLTAGERRIALRRQLNALVAAQHHRTGQPHGKIHAELRRICGGPPSAQATIEQLEERIATVQTLPAPARRAPARSCLGSVVPRLGRASARSASARSASVGSVRTV